MFDKFHVMGHLGNALDEIRKSEYSRLKILYRTAAGAEVDLVETLSYSSSGKGGA